MKVRHTIWILAVGFAFAGCVAAVDDEDPEDSQSSLVEGATEGSSQTTAAATVVRAAALAEGDAIRTQLSLDLGFDVEPILSAAKEGPAQAAEAALEIHRAMLEERGITDAAVAMNQFLAPDPSNPAGPIAGIDAGCASFGGFMLSGSISEPDPPLARLVVTHDVTADPGCRIDGAVHYDLRVVPEAGGGNTLAIVVSYPAGLSVQPGSGDPYLVSAGGSIWTGLVFDASNAFSAVAAGADYCVTRGMGGAELCFEDLTLAVSSAVDVSFIDGTCAACGARYGDPLVDGLAGDEVTVMPGASVGFDASGSVTFAGIGLTLGNATTPISMEVGFDATDGWSATLAGEVTTTLVGEVATYAFSAEPGAPAAGFAVTRPIGELSLTFDGCAARTVGTATRSACFTDLDLLAAEGAREGSVLLTADGVVAITSSTTDATYTFTAARADVLLGTSVIFDGAVTRTTPSVSHAVLFESFELGWDDPSYSLSGIIEAQQDGATLVRAAFCDGSTYTYDATTDTVALAGCVTFTSPTYGTLGLGETATPMAVTLGPDVSSIDGPLTYDDAMARRIASITFEGWRAENLESGDLDVVYHRRVTGRAAIDVLGIRGSVESMTGVETTVSADEAAGTAAVQVDGDLGIAIDVGPQTVSGSLLFTGYTATFMDQMGDQTIAHLGVIDMDLTLGSSSVLPTSAMRVTFGDGTEPLFTVTTEALTTLDGSVVLGIGCRTGTCNQNIDVVLTGVAFETPSCGRQHPHTGTAVITGLNPSTSAIVPALRVRCDCNARAGRDTLLPRAVTMVFTDATPTDRRIQIPDARGICGLQLNASCREPGAAWLRAESVCME